MNLNKLAQEIHQNAKDKGFYEQKDRNISELLMLVVSELGEAQEALRKDKRADVETYQYCKDATDIHWKDKADYVRSEFEKNIKDSFEDEIADAIIRLLDLCAYLKIDIDFHIEEKMVYNKKRDYKHNKRF